MFMVAFSAFVIEENGPLARTPIEESDVFDLSMKVAL